MHRRGQALWRYLTAFVAVAVLALPISPAMAQGVRGPTWQIYIDAPLGGTTIFNGQQTLIGGWAADLAGPGTGVDEVRVYLDSANGRLLGNATYGKPRPDVAQSLGNQAFLNTGYDLLFTPTNVSTGPHTIVVQAHSTANNWQSQTIQVNFAAGPGGDRYEDRDRSQGGRYGDRYGRGGMAGYGSNCMMDPSMMGGYGMGGSGMGGYGMGSGMDSYGGGYGMGSGSYGMSSGDSSCYDMPRPPPPFAPPILPGGLAPAPLNVTVIGVGPTAVGLSWSAVPGALSYRILQSTGGSPFTAAASTSLTATSALVTGLNPNTTYQFQVVSVDAAGLSGQPSPPILVMTTPGP